MSPTEERRVLQGAVHDDELDRILRAIHDDRNPSDPGEKPRCTQTVALPGLYSTDTLVLRQAGDMAPESDGDLVNSREILSRISDARVTEQAFLDSRDVLAKHW